MGNLSPLQRRLLTALALVPVVIAAVLWLPTPAFAVLLTLVVAMGAWEWCNLSGIRSSGWRSLYLAIVFIAMWGLWAHPSWQFGLFVFSALWWFAQAVRLLRIRRIFQVAGMQPWLLVIGLLVLLAPWAALIHLHGVPSGGPVLVLFLLFLIWTADSSAYFVGRQWGRAKLAPVVSPGKTRVGVYGALIGALICGGIFAWMRGLTPVQTVLLLMLCVLAAMISVVGDLYESFLKRRRGVKDSGQLLPGHGGVLDRIDSLTAAAPVFLLGINLMGIGQ